MNVVLIHEFPDGVSVVGVVEFKGALLVATTNKIYRIVDLDAKLEPLEFTTATEEAGTIV